MTAPSSTDLRVPRVFVFDLDDTLYLERDFAFSGFAAVEAHLHAAYGDVVLSGTCRQLFERGARRNVFDLALKSFGIDADATSISELVEIYRSHTPSISTCPDTDRFLAVNRAQLAIITDGPPVMQCSKIEALGIRRHFGCVIPTGELPEGMGKPHPHAFEQVMKWSEEPGHTHVYVADNPAKDFIAPRALGWRTVQIDRIGRIHSPETNSPMNAADIRIETLDNLAEALGMPL